MTEQQMQRIVEAAKRCEGSLRTAASYAAEGRIYMVHLLMECAGMHAEEAFRAAKS